ncbi:flagellar motor switch phosphatase FliY [Candidatus Contubernalis alkaliaceticus]|uniref:flagellar motor switch phosphatase FliY n=1 Tax=Candidatus Contubernalis alkaliaceticus TaxID=338645 RepID=UPI001F4BF10E|nr:flagellar motor switch phosphatase FliY [Candidatus Contubernalis alkalaceticus]UNC91774.1 flagellar motor switch phosphatase FliY [Candidatus Contubernalis alkalaceticus]
MSISLEDMQQEALKELSNIAFGAGGTALSQLLGRSANITMPSLQVVEAGELSSFFAVSDVLVKMGYSDGLSGKSLIIFPRDYAVFIGQIMMMQESSLESELSEMHLSALTEALNQVLGAGATAMSEMLNRNVGLVSPQVEHRLLTQEDFQELIGEEGAVLQVTFQMVVEGLPEGRLVQFWSLKLASEMASCLLGDMFPEPEEKSQPSIDNPLDNFNDMEKETLKEIGNISLGSSATTLSQLVSRRINITAPKLSYTSVEDIKHRYPAPCVIVEVSYSEGLIGKNVLIINAQDAVIIAQLMMMQEPDGKGEIDEISISAVSEAMNQMMGASATAMSDLFNRMINISPPRLEYKEIDTSTDREGGIFDIEEGLIQIAFKIEVEGLIDSEILQLIPLDFAKDMTSYLLGGYKNGEEMSPSKESEREKEVLGVEGEKEESSGEDSIVTSYPSDVGNIYSPLEMEGLELVKDITIELQGIVGKVKVPLREILKLGKGSVMEFDSYAGEPIDIYANGKLIARADIVAVSDFYGIRLREIITKQH